MWHDKLKEANVSLHVIATGGGAGLQQQLWEVPGSSAYLSGASFPYAMEETEELLGFKPESFCSREAAIDLASVAYMKAFRFGGKNPVGLALTASVASEREHRGEHRVFACVITNEQVRTCKYVLKKGVGSHQRHLDGALCDDLGFFMLLDTLGLNQSDFNLPPYEDAAVQAYERFFAHPFFAANGKRFAGISNAENYALMPGSFNPPHEGHFGLADSFKNTYGKNVVFEIGTNPPHKKAPTVQELLQRAKMLKGRDTFFSVDMPMYIEKTRAYPGTPLIMGADTLLRILDPKWGVDARMMFNEMASYNTKIYVAQRMVDGKFIGWSDINNAIGALPELDNFDEIINKVLFNLPGRWDISSTELRNK